MILKKSSDAEAAQRPTSFLVFLFCWIKKNSGGSGGNVGIRRPLPDFQGVVETGENLQLVFAVFHNPAISTALLGCCVCNYRIRDGPGDSILHTRSTLALAAPIFRANSVSLIAAAIRSIASIPMPDLR